MRSHQSRAKHKEREAEAAEAAAVGGDTLETMSAEEASIGKQRHTSGNPIPLEGDAEFLPRKRVRRGRTHMTVSPARPGCTTSCSPTLTQSRIRVGRTRMHLRRGVGSDFSVAEPGALQAAGRAITRQAAQAVAEADGGRTDPQ